MTAAGVGSDMGQLAPMVEQVTQRCGRSPEKYLVDGGYPAHDQLDQVATQTVVYAPVPKSKDPAIDPHVAKDGDSEAVADWRQRMGTQQAKAVYKERAALNYLFERLPHAKSPADFAALPPYAVQSDSTGPQAAIL